MLSTQTQTGRFLGNGGRRFINSPSQEAWEVTRVYCDQHDLPVVYRHWWPPHDQLYDTDPEAWGRDTARQILADLDRYPRWPRNLYAVGYNEVAVWDMVSAKLYGRFTIALARALAERGVKLLAFSFSVGHPSIEIWPHLYPAMRVVMSLGGGIDLHEYYLQEEGPGHPLDWTWTFGRHRRIWRSLPTDLKGILIHIGETGLDREGNGYNDGFRARIGPQVFSEHLLWMGRALIVSRRLGINILDASIFIAEDDGAWPSFRLLGAGQDMLEAVINQVNKEAKEEEPMIISVGGRVEPPNPKEGDTAIVRAWLTKDGAPQRGIITSIVHFPIQEQASNLNADEQGQVAYPLEVRDREPLPVGLVVPISLTGIPPYPLEPATATISFEIGGVTMAWKDRLPNSYQAFKSEGGTDEAFESIIRTWVGEGGDVEESALRYLVGTRRLKATQARLERLSQAGKAAFQELNDAVQPYLPLR